MIIAVQGTNSFNDYNVFLRAVGVALSGTSSDDQEITIYSVGPVNVNNFTAEFCNIAEKGMKWRGKKIKYYKVTQQWLEENISYVNYFAFMSKPNEGLSKLTGIAQLNNVEVGIFRY